MKLSLGSGKAVFIHLLRLLECENINLKHELDHRYVSAQFQGLKSYLQLASERSPPFGVDSVRRITSNRSELKKMTAHDYEDMLQVSGVNG